MAEKKTVEEIVLEQLTKLVEEKGELPWTKPYPGYGRGSSFGVAGGGNVPMSLKTGKEYRGLNPFILWATGYSNPYWVTYKQAQEFGGNVKRDQAKRYTVITFWKPYDRKVTDDATGEVTKKKSFLLRYFRVYNVEQCEGLKHKRLTELEAGKKVTETLTPEQVEFQAIESAQKIADEYFSREKTLDLICTGEDVAYYAPLLDNINLPAAEKFTKREGYYATLFHEMGHSTGHKSRLNRDLSGIGTRYAKEELVAEMSAAFLCGHAGIANEVVDNSAAYLKGWMEKINGDPKLLISAAAQAQKAVDRVLGRTWAKEEPKDEGAKAA